MFVLVELFKSSTEVLCPWYKHLDVPDFVSQGISAGAPTEGQLYDLSAFDRLVIYTDSSSKSHNRHRPPLLIADVGQPDAWAYVVLGETYPQNGKPGSCKLERMKTPNSQCTERCRWLKVTKAKKTKLCSSTNEMCKDSDLVSTNTQQTWREKTLSSGAGNKPLPLYYIIL